MDDVGRIRGLQNHFYRPESGPEVTIEMDISSVIME